jgi:DNA processing protein
LNFSPTQQQIALTFLSGIGSRRARIIIGHFNDLNEFFSEKKLNLAEIPGIQPDFVHYTQRIAALEAAQKVTELLDKIGATTVFFTEKEYPRRLKQCADAPLLLYAKGNINWNPEKVVSIVGTRHASAYGKQLTEELVEGLKASGATIVSGMAYGIDVAAHSAALHNELPTIGVLGHGLHTIYPAIHRKIAQEMITNGGLVSEFAPGLKPEPAYFPMRNRIVAGMADATVVIESGVKGGSLITATMANDYNRDVFAFPGDVNKPFSAGCLRLIQQHKAHLLTGAEDLLKAMNWEEATGKKAVQRNLFVELTASETQLVEVLKTKTEVAIDTLGYLTSLSPGSVSALLLNLEFKGVVKALPGKRYTLI